MDFFAHQDRARRNTGWLVVLFILAVTLLVFLANFFISLVFGWSTVTSTGHLTQPGSHTFLSQFSWSRFVLIGMGVWCVVLGAIIYKRVQLSEGGKRIAESLGGHRIYPNSDDLDERRILNVVEEMALASGMPVPPVYLLGGEMGINAFAAGDSASDAVIGVTRGCIQLLDRNQLQGVIAHEFSHILNGDMRLNMRLVTVLHGIEFVGGMGKLMLRVRPNRRGGIQIFLLGGGLWLIGFLGTLFGDMIRSAVSRQREFLADASAVQFTRNPQGIADALKVIGGYTAGTEIFSPSRGEVSHIFFGQALSRLGGMFDTHPPVMDRILRIQPDWDGAYIHTRLRRQEEKADEADTKKEQLAKAVALGAALNGEFLDPAELLMQGNIASVQEGLSHIPDSLKEQAHDPLGATALMLGLLFSGDEAVYQKQRGYLKQKPTPGLLALIDKQTPALEQLSRALYLPLLELSMPALKCLSQEQYVMFKQRLLLLIRADDEIDLFEWCLYQELQHYLDPEFGKVRTHRPKYREIQQLSDAYRLVLSVLVYEGHDDPQEIDKAFNRGIGSAGLYNLTIQPQDGCDLQDFRAAVKELAYAYPRLKPRMLMGFVNAVKQDGVITVIEREMVRSIAAVMDSPIPKLDD